MLSVGVVLSMSASQDRRNGDVDALRRGRRADGDQLAVDSFITASILLRATVILVFEFSSTFRTTTSGFTSTTLPMMPPTVRTESFFLI